MTHIILCQIQPCNYLHFAINTLRASLRSNSSGIQWQIEVHLYSPIITTSLKLISFTATPWPSNEFKFFIISQSLPFCAAILQCLVFLAIHFTRFSLHSKMYFTTMWLFSVSVAHSDLRILILIILWLQFAFCLFCLSHLNSMSISSNTP